MPVKTMLRNLARRWADKVMIEIADDWQMRSIRAEAAVDRLTQERDRLRRIVELAQSWRSYFHAPDPDPEVWARLESALGRAIDALPVDAAGVAGPEAKQP